MLKSSFLRVGLRALFALTIATLNAQTVSFVQQNQIASGGSPNALALADVTNDGRLDLIIANQSSASVNILRGLGEGFFQPITTQATGAGPRAMALGDFNRDGRLDVAVANLASNSLTILLGNGNGTFYTLTTLAVAAPTTVIAADFNRDGKLDLAVTSGKSNAVSIFLGNGNGTFIPFSSASTGNYPVSLVLADLNSDGQPDLAVANANSNDVSILLGNGNGTFQSARTFAAGPSPTYLALGDFDSNGFLDLAVANGAGNAFSSVSLLLGLGNGVFLAPRTFAAGAHSSFLISGDFNRDGKVDLAVANTGANTVSILLGTGTGNFLPPLDFVSGTAPAWISVVDLNGDGKPDLLVANSGSNTVTVLINRTGILPSPAVTSFVSAAGIPTGPVAPGELITIFGSNLGPEPGLAAQLGTSAFLATQLGPTQAFFDGIAAPLLYTASGQVSTIVPFGLGGRTATQLMVNNGGQFSAPMTIPVAASAPALFTADGSGQGQGAILNQDGSVNAPGNPAARGSVVVLYATGAGATNPPGIDGMIASSSLDAPMLPVSVSIGGAPAQVLYAGAAPGLVSGVLQINARVPDASNSGAASVVLQVGAALSQPGVTLSVQ
ncbi:MAG TPA: FG-GAP-like repeat-containing protein [Bryobacteraceae bacterium]|nr:FG-GAP-like repeat-containing protein [Bryobacteraceae bacterium]